MEWALLIFVLLLARVGFVAYRYRRLRRDGYSVRWEWPLARMWRRLTGRSHR